MAGTMMNWADAVKTRHSHPEGLGAGRKPLARHS